MLHTQMFVCVTRVCIYVTHVHVCMLMCYVCDTCYVCAVVTCIRVCLCTLLHALVCVLHMLCMCMLALYVGAWGLCSISFSDVFHHILETWFLTEPTNFWALLALWSPCLWPPMLWLRLYTFIPGFYIDSRSPSSWRQACAAKLSLPGLGHLSRLYVPILQ